MNATARRRLWFGLSTGGLALVVAAAVFRVSAPRPRPSHFPTNTVVDVSQIVRTRALHWKQSVMILPANVEPVPSQWEGIDSAERINLQIMRRYQEHWNRFEKPQAPFRPALPGITEGDK